MTTSLGLEDLRLLMGDVVDALPQDEAEVLTALYWERLSLREVAIRLGRSHSSVRRTRNRAFKRIRALVEVS